MQSVVIKRSIVIAGHKTSVSLEDPFWEGLKDIGKDHNKSLSNLVHDIDTQRLNGNLSSAIRLFVLSHFREQATGNSAGHGAEIQIPQSGQQTAQANGKAPQQLAR